MGYAEEQIKDYMNNLDQHYAEHYQDGDLQNDKSNLLDVQVSQRYSFVLPCRECGKEFNVNQTKEFVESRTDKKLTAYYELPKQYVIGFSEGGGDTFECFYCHVIKWNNLVNAG